jgi:uncharacterized membrane protein
MSPAAGAADAEPAGASGLDLVLVVAATVGAGLALVVPSVPRPVAWAVGVPLLVFLPGYAVVAAVLPARPGAVDTGRVGPGWPLRFGLALLGTVLVVALTGVGLSATVGIRLLPALAVLTAVTVFGVVVAAVRRSRLPARARANPLAGTVRLLPVPAATSRFQGVAVVVGLLALVGAIAFAGAVPTQEEGYTEAYLLTENETGALVAADDNTTFRAGVGRPVHVAIENHEETRQTYEVVTVAQRVAENGSVFASERVDAFAVEVDPNQRATAERRFAPTLTGDRIRLRVLVYDDGTPDRPSVTTADLAMRLWIDVPESASAADGIAETDTTAAESPGTPTPTGAPNSSTPTATPNPSTPSGTPSTPTGPQNASTPTETSNDSSPGGSTAPVTAD